MKLPEYVKKLVEILENDPDAKNLTVISASDDEGNDYSEVSYNPCIGIWEPINREFDVLDVDDPDSEYTDEDINAICIN